MPPPVLPAHRRLFGTRLPEPPPAWLDGDPVEAATRIVRAHAAIIAAAPMPEDGMPVEGDPGRFTCVIIVEGLLTTDHRQIAPGALTWRMLPLPIMSMPCESGWGHEGAMIAGAITEITRQGNLIVGSGVYDAGEAGQELRRLVDAQMLRWVSADLEVTASEYVEVYTDPMAEPGWDWPDEWWETVTEGRIMGCTALSFPAFPQAVIVPEGSPFPAVDPENVPNRPGMAVVPGLAAAAHVIELPESPPRSWFENPGFSQLTHVTVTDEGRVLGHVAPWNEAHIGLAERTVAPRSKSGYAHYMTKPGPVCDNGERVAVGVITMGTGHARLSGISPRAAADHYDNTGAAFADVVVGEDAFGIWCSGALRPGVTGEQVRAFMCSDVSGDWRPYGTDLEMVAVLAVNVAGFPTLAPPALAASADAEPEAELVGWPGAQVARISGQTMCARDGEGNMLALVAAGVMTRDPATQAIATLRGQVRELARRIAAIEQPGRDAAVAELRARIEARLNGDAVAITDADLDALRARIAAATSSTSA